MNNGAFETELRDQGRLVYYVRGRSMEPMLRQNRDLVHLRLPEGSLKKNDVALFRRPSGKYVLHRVVGEDERGYIFLGDNCKSREFGVPADTVIGVLTEFVRKGKVISANDRRYLAYVRLWEIMYPLRALVFGVIDCLRSVVHRCKA